MDSMTVYTRDGGKGYIIDEELRAKEEARKAAEKKGMEELQALYEAKDADALLKALLSEDNLPMVRFKAIEMIGVLGGLDVIEPIRNHVFKNEVMREKAEESIRLIHQRNFTKECPFCAEIIKARAVVCKHCGKNLPEST
jgi:hypothetical protein